MRDKEKITDMEATNEKAGEEHCKLQPLVGNYFFSWVDDDHVKVVQKFDNAIYEAVMAAGAFGRLIDCAFICANLNRIDISNDSGQPERGTKR